MSKQDEKRPYHRAISPQWYIKKGDTFNPIKVSEVGKKYKISSIYIKCNCGKYHLLGLNIL